MKNAARKVTQNPEPILKPDQAEKVHRRNILNIVAAAQAGKPLTAAQQRQIDQYRAASISSTEPKIPAEWVGSRAELAKALGLHPNSIPRIIRDHKAAPDLPKPRQNGDHNVADWKRFIAAHGINAKAEDSQSISEIKLLQEIEKLHRYRRENQLADGAVIPKADSARILHQSHEHIKIICRQIWEEELPPVIAGLNAGAIRTHARKANDRLCKLAKEYEAQLADL